LTAGISARIAPDKTEDEHKIERQRIGDGRRRERESAIRPDIDVDGHCQQERAKHHAQESKAVLPPVLGENPARRAG